MARTRKKKAGNIFSSKDKDNEHIYPMVFLCVALSRCCYDNPVKFLNNVSILFNMRPFIELLKDSQSQDEFLLNNRGFKKTKVTLNNDDYIKSKYSGKLPYKLLAAYINKGADIISKKGITENESMRKSVNELQDRMDVLPPEFYKNKTVFADNVSGTRSKIRSIFVCTVNDLNCYVLHHMDFDFIFVHVISWITPTSRHFVRNHSHVPDIDPDEYTLTVSSPLHSFIRISKSMICLHT